MSSPGDATVPATRRARKSIGSQHIIRKARDKENATIDVASELASSRKARSKSIGPGGLDSLRPGTGNRRASIAAPRSILKPRMSAIAEIPSLKSAKRASIGSDDTIRRKSPRNSKSGDFTGSRIALRTEEEQQAAARERDEQDRRDARRKSLANRRVSFAAEATLHTFHDIDMQDSTASTDYSSRRSSNVTGGQPQATPQQRRSSAANATGYEDDDSVTSILYSDDSEPADGVEEVEDAEEEEMSNSDSDDGTMMTIDTEEVTGTTIASDRSAPFDNESSTLEEALRLAAERAGTQRLDDYYDKAGEEAAEEAEEDDEEIIPSFGWIKKDTKRQSSSAGPTAAASRPSYSNTEDTEAGMEMDITHNMGRIIRPHEVGGSEDEAEMSMDVTKAFGGILPAQSPESSPIRDVPNDTPRREEATMEFTTALGGIRSAAYDDTTDDCAGDEEMSMEFTMAMGGVLGNNKRKSIDATRRRTLNELAEVDATMDMTIGVGRILSNKAHHDSAVEPQGDDDETSVDMDLTGGMDMTAAIGGILNSQGRRSLGRQIMVEEADKPNSPKTAIFNAMSKQQPRRRSSRTALSESPNLSAGLLPLRGKQPSPEEQRTPRTNRKSSSPTKQPTLQPARVPRKSQSHSPQAPTSARRRSSRLSPAKSPTRQTQSPTKSTAPSPAKSSSNATPVLHRKPESAKNSPANYATPETRRVSGVGADRSGLGSPRIAEVFDRRSSIGDSASKFIPGKSLVTFEDPKALSREVDDERSRDEERERAIPRFGQRQDDKDATLNLREMIDSLSPGRKPLKGRKSLHVGSARGLLGKRPVELDDEDVEDNDGVKRLRGHQGSPVKNVRLQQPTKSGGISGDIFGFRGKMTAPELHQSLSSPLKATHATSPREDALYRKENHTVHGTNIDSTEKNHTEENDEERIHLQDFLNLISVRFMELQTTKRRHTTAPGTLQDGTTANGEDDMSLERCVVASACTVPMLELYQHSCRELKKYIAEGRRMVKEIEADTLEDNPALFREYLTAAPDVKALMNNQFKNVKTHSRLLSKAMWYEWRMKLQEGLREGLVKISSDMDGDCQALKEQMDILESVLPGLTSTYEALEEEHGTLEEAAQEIADCDPEELSSARQELVSLDADIEAKKGQIAELRLQLQAAQTSSESLSTKKASCLADIAQSEKIRENCRGWSSAEVNSLKGRAEALEKKVGWAVTGVHGTSLSMTYRREIEIVFDVTSFQPGGANSQIDLWYIADGREKDPLPRTVEKDFFLQCIRDYIRALQQSTTTISGLLNIVQQSWNRATRLSSQIRRVNSTFPTQVRKTSDSSIEVVTSMLVVPFRTRVQVTLELQNQNLTKGLDMDIASSVAVVYGENFKVTKIGDFLASKIGRQIGTMDENWSDIFVELHRRLLARGRK
ncbi:chromosome segregation protein [Cordyceps fumosorosea ARSEF 2679]|uniref:Chromosome segregation protein n=1 Tax=Cordyceps fumosorosea (strain ARSEF 2679) TaxID=1081104 RepID=A0A162MR83_CORFA|nr:chromosome segregation protein [Cordyceps fumosorosea ARSEF 2679]OAA68929.1 chromosome segregation protein [Cordyceps fumosorosea ARSEF 2679]